MTGTTSKKYKCVNCDAAFIRPSKLLVHERVHSGERPFVCSKEGCGKGYTSKTHLKRHEKSHCHKAIPSEKFKCDDPECTKSFDTALSLDAHIVKCHNIVLYKYKCKHCNDIFRHKDKLAAHEFKHTGLLPFKCPADGCNCSYPSQSKLAAHKRKHEGYNCSEENCNHFAVTWSDLRKHVALQHPKQFKCNECSAIFYKKHKLRAHMVQHESSSDLFSCPHEGCKRMYSKNSNLQQHLRAAHSENAKLFECPKDDCAGTFKHKCSLDRHVLLHEKGHKRKVSLKKKSARWEARMAKKLSGCLLQSTTMTTASGSFTPLNPDSRISTNQECKVLD